MNNKSLALIWINGVNCLRGGDASQHFIPARPDSIRSGLSVNLCVSPLKLMPIGVVNMPVRYLFLVCALIFTQGCNSKEASVTTEASAAGENVATSRKQEIDQPAATAESWTIHGQVVDKNGQFVDHFEAASIWSSNGVYWNKSGDIPPEERANVWKREGVLAVRPQFLAARDSKGTFSLEIQDRPRVPVFAVNDDHTHGGIAVVERSSANTPIRIELNPLVRVTGKVFCPESGGAPDWAKAEIYVVGGGNFYLTQCGTYQGNVSFLLPPGEYEIVAKSESPVAMMRVPGKPIDIPLHGNYPRGKHFTVPSGVADFDLGVLELLLARDSDGNSVDITQFYGKRPPNLDIIDARNVPTDIKLDDYRGKWVLVEFWALWCSPCVAVELPKLSEFYKRHTEQHDQFEILAICDTEHEGIRTIKELEPHLSVIRQNAWGGKKLPFPVLLDNESRTASAYAIGGRPSTFLIDPDGNLMNTTKGTALEMLAEKLAEMSPREK